MKSNWLKYFKLNSSVPAVGLKVVASNLQAPALATQLSYAVEAMTKSTRSAPEYPFLYDDGIVTDPHYPLRNNFDDG